MAQKGNVCTIRTSIKKKLNFLEISNSSEFLCGYAYLKIIEKFFTKKNILITASELNFTHSRLNLNLTLFFRTAKLTHYRNKITSHFGCLKKLGIKNFCTVTKLFVPIKLMKKKNLILMKLKIINNFINFFLLKRFFHKTARFVNILFARKFSLFIDFLKISVLLSKNQISPKTYLYVLSEIFKVLPKNKHSRFFFFLKQFFQILIQGFNKIKGIKLLISGKLLGKTRASNKCINCGSVPVQSICKKIEFEKAHVFTLYGVYGFKIWFYTE
jgi:hypothetical protein